MRVSAGEEQVSAQMGEHAASAGATGGREDFAMAHL